MEAIIEAIEVSRDSELGVQTGVTCIFCGLPTPVRAATRKAFEMHLPQPMSHISIVRCEICEKEAPYLSKEVSDIGEIFRARGIPSVEKQYGV
jgi:hypothetical protein